MQLKMRQIPAPIWLFCKKKRIDRIITCHGRNAFTNFQSLPRPM